MYNNEHNSNKYINYICIVNLINKKILVEYCANKLINEAFIKKHVKNIIDTILLLNLNPFERHNESINENLKIYAMLGKSKYYSCIAIIKSDYPNRFAYKLLDSLYDKAFKNQTELDENNKRELNDIQLFMVQLERDYNDIEKINKIKNIQKDVDEIKINVKNNINGMLENLELVENLNNQSDALREKAKEYKNNAKELKKATWWQNKKLTIAVGGAGIGFGGYFLFKIFSK